MTRKEKVFRHIEDNGNAMRYTDIIKFAYEDIHGKGSFDKKINRGFYACAFTYYSYWSSRYSAKSKNIGNPKGHFVTPTRNGHLFKLSNGLWSVHRPLGWVRKDVDTVLAPEVKNTNILEDGEYQSMCDVLKKYNTTPDQLDDLATKYYVEKQCDANSAYHWAYYDLLEKSGAISDTTKALQKEIDALADRMIAEDKTKAPIYIVIDKDDSYYRGKFCELELQEFFTDRNPNDYVIMELGRIVSLEKKVTTTFTIK